MSNVLNSNNISIKVNGQNIAFAQECTLSSQRECKEIGSYGDSDLSVIAVGSKCYNLKVIKIEQLDEDFEFMELENFTVSIRKQGRIFNFLNCKWTNIEEKVVNGKAVVKSVSIASPTLDVVEE